MKYIDLHCHTIYSDGISSPEELVKAVKLKGVDIMAKTDHDNLDGYYETKKEADEWGLILLPGVEFSAGKYHLLGLNFDPENQEFLNTIEKSKNLQRENTRQRVEILADYGLPICIEKIEHYFPRSRLGKMNVLMTMMKDKECRNWLYNIHGDVFRENLKEFYLSKKGIAGNEEGMKDLEREVIINGVHNAGGLAILAHPAKDIDNLKELDILREQGIDGLEVQPNFYSDYPPYLEYAKKHNLLITYGSDYHGAFMNRPLLGRGMNKLSRELEERLNLDYSQYETFETNERRLALIN